MSLLKTPSGDVSMRRISAAGYLIASLGMALASIFREIDFQVFIGVTAACLTALGLTVPDQFNTLKKNT